MQFALANPRSTDIRQVAPLFKIVSPGRSRSCRHHCVTFETACAAQVSTDHPSNASSKQPRQHAGSAAAGQCPQHVAIMGYSCGLRLVSPGRGLVHASAPMSSRITWGHLGTRQSCIFRSIQFWHAVRCSSQRRVHQVDPQSGCPVVSWDTVPASQLPALNSGRAHVSSHTTPKRRRLNSFASKKAECLGRTPERLPTRGQLAAWLSGPFTGVFSGISGQVLVRLVAQAPLHGPTPTRSRSDQGPTSLQSRGDIPSADTT